MPPFRYRDVYKMLPYVLVVAWSLLATAVHAGEAAAWRVLPPADWLARCDGDCSVMLFGGRSLTSNSVQDLLDDAIPNNWIWDNSTIFGGALSRTVASYGGQATIDLEMGAAQRFVDSDATELWAAAYLRWHDFPWNDVLRTSIGASTGINYASNVSESEEMYARREGVHGARLLHYFSPEIAVSLPGYENIELVTRLHHRSGVFGLFSGVRGADHYGVVGLRMKF